MGRAATTGMTQGDYHRTIAVVKFKKEQWARAWTNISPCRLVNPRHRRDQRYEGGPNCLPDVYTTQLEYTQYLQESSN